jgi:hypothetical protein
MRLCQRSSSTVQPFCFTFNHRRVGPASYRLVSCLATRPSKSRAITSDHCLHLGSRLQAAESALRSRCPTWGALLGYRVRFSVTDQCSIYVGVLPVTGGTGHRCVVLHRGKFTARAVRVRGIRWPSSTSVTPGPLAWKKSAPQQNRFGRRSCVGKKGGTGGSTVRKFVQAIGGSRPERRSPSMNGLGEAGGRSPDR